MFGESLIRRSFGWVLTLVLGIYATHYVEYHPALRHQLWTSKNVAVVLLAIAALAVLGWSLMRPNVLKVIVAFVLGFSAAALGRELFTGNVAFFGIMLIGVIVLYLWTIIVDRFVVR